jgi:uncharacterized protein YecE (DUF72 family)
MEIPVGTSGYSYKVWKGIFYPEKLAAKNRLQLLGQRLGALEIHQTSSRPARLDRLAIWAAAVPEEFRLALKAPPRITRFERLRSAEEETAYQLDTRQVLAPRLGIVLAQLPLRISHAARGGSQHFSICSLTTSRRRSSFATRSGTSPRWAARAASRS